MADQFLLFSFTYMKVLKSSARVTCYVLLTGYIISSCQPVQDQQQTMPQDASHQATTEMPNEVSASAINPLEQRLIDRGLVNLQSLDSTIVVDLRYSTTNNFVGVDVYGDFNAAYMQSKPAQMLAQANAYLKEYDPDYTLYIFDATRPRSVQQILWDTLDYPEAEKAKYVANPQKGSIHNYGAAVDLTIARPDGKPLDMGTDFDYFGVLAYPVHEQKMLAQGKLTKVQADNRQLLREVMMRAGFSPITSEWWHFNAMSQKEADKRYGIVE